MRKVICAAGGMMALLGLATLARAREPGESLAWLCQKTFIVVRPGDSTGTARILAPNRRLAAWSEGAWQQAPELFRTAVIVQDLTTARTTTVFRTRATRAGRVVGPSGRLYPLGISDMFCVVDWSRDSQRLLVRALVGRRESDNTFVDVWVYDVPSKRRRPVPQSALRVAIARHWIRKGADFRDVYYWLDVEGWEDATVPRLVFTATVLEGRPESFPAEFDGFLGAWSNNLSGGAPRLLTEDRTATFVRRNGAVQTDPP